MSPSYLVSAAADHTLRIWSPTTGQCLATLKGHSAAITCFHHDTQLNRIVSGSDGGVKAWELSSAASGAMPILSNIAAANNGGRGSASFLGSGPGFAFTQGPNGPEPIYGRFQRDLVSSIQGVWRVRMDERRLVCALQKEGGRTWFEVLDFGDDIVPGERVEGPGDGEWEEDMDDEDDEDDDDDEDGEDGVGNRADNFPHAGFPRNGMHDDHGGDNGNEEGDDNDHVDDNFLALETSADSRNGMDDGSSDIRIPDDNGNIMEDIAGPLTDSYVGGAVSNNFGLAAISTQTDEIDNQGLGPSVHNDAFYASQEHALRRALRQASQNFTMLPSVHLQPSSHHHHHLHHHHHHLQQHRPGPLIDPYRQRVNRNHSHHDHHPYAASNVSTASTSTGWPAVTVGTSSSSSPSHVQPQDTSHSRTAADLSSTSMSASASSSTAPSATSQNRIRHSRLREALNQSASLANRGSPIIHTNDSMVDGSRREPHHPTQQQRLHHMFNQQQPNIQQQPQWPNLVLDLKFNSRRTSSINGPSLSRRHRTTATVLNSSLLSSSLPTGSTASTTAVGTEAPALHAVTEADDDVDINTDHPSLSSSSSHAGQAAVNGSRHVLFESLDQMRRHRFQELERTCAESSSSSSSSSSLMSTVVHRNQTVSDEDESRRPLLLVSQGGRDGVNSIKEDLTQSIGDDDDAGTGVDVETD